MAGVPGTRTLPAAQQGPIDINLMKEWGKGNVFSYRKITIGVEN